MQPGREDRLLVIAEEPELKLRPPGRVTNVFPPGDRPPPRDPKMSEVGRFQNLAPLGLAPLRTHLLIPLDKEDPIAFASARHRAEVPLIPGFRVMMVDPTGDLLGPLHRTGHHASRVDKDDELVEDFANFLHPGK